MNDLAAEMMDEMLMIHVEMIEMLQVMKKLLTVMQVLWKMVEHV